MDADKIKDFFIFHVEKIIVVLVIAAAGFLLYQGLQLPNYLDTHNPDTLSANATQVKNAIDENHNDQIIPDRVPLLDIIAETKKRYDPVDPSPYDEQLKLWILEKDQAIVRRQDPQLIPPRSLIAKGVLTTIAVRKSKETYALTALEPAEPLEKVEAAAPVRERRPRRRRGGGGEEEMMEMMMMMEEESDMMPEMDLMAESMASGATRKFNSEFDFGYHSTGMTDDKKYPNPEVAWFIAGTAVIPHKEMYEAFEAALKDADGYKPGRDTPFYFNFEVQRADVTDKSVDQLVEEDWINVWDRKKYTLLAARKWSGFAPEIVPSDYRDELLTTWIPPVLVDDYRTFSLHPLIPLKPKSVLEAEARGEEVLPEDIKDEDLFDVEMELAQPGKRGAGMAAGMEMMDEDDMMGMDMGMGMGMLGIGATGIEKNPVDYKLLRFYDFVGFANSPKPGRKYVYRVRYAVNDPNFPANPEMQPRVSTLAPEAAKRVLDLMVKAEQTNDRSFQRWTDWSEPCDPVSLPSNEDYWAGPVQAPSSSIWTVAGKEVPYTRDPPTAKIVASQFNGQLATRVPMVLEVTEGSVLSHKAESADVVDPISLEVKKLENAELNSRTTIVDLDGGTPLRIAEGVTSPGLWLLYDMSGSLQVTDDVSDQEFYRIYSYAKERGE